MRVRPVLGTIRVEGFAAPLATLSTRYGTRPATKLVRKLRRIMPVAAREKPGTLKRKASGGGAWRHFHPSRLLAKHAILTGPRLTPPTAPAEEPGSTVLDERLTTNSKRKLR